MGGKTKQTQRTKNNVRPSSSGRSAELLNNAVRLDPGLMSTSGGKVLPVLFPTLAAPLDPSLNPEFTLCLKKLNKKDPITKTKALQELCDLVKKADVEDVVAALPSWAHYYRTLTTDTDHKVRESAQITHGAVVAACGRRVAPQLRALLPPWLQAQYDEYAPAAAAARASLKATFPENKLPDVISFCMSEVIAHLLENLVGNGAENALNKKILTPEEKELQWARLVTASLQGLEYFTQHLAPQHDDWLWAQLEPMLRAPSFWKMADHKSQQVKASWYGALGRIIARYSGTFGATYGHKTARLLLASAAPHKPLWTCLLVLMRHVQADAWLDKKELLVKRIIDLLENGGWGDAKHLSSMLLPLLAYLPDHLLTKDFYEAFFGAVFKGLEKKGVMSSKSERQAWITGLSECLRYLTLQQEDYVVEVVTAAHRVWLERALAAREPQVAANLVRHSAASMAALVKYWLRQAAHAGKYDQLVRNFWQNVASTAVAQIDKLSTEQSDINALVENHILLLQTLKSSFAQDAKKVKSIKFDDELPAAAAESDGPALQCDAAVAERYKHNLDDTVEKICAQYFEFADEKQVANSVFGPLITLLIEFDDKNLFEGVSRRFGAESVYDMYDRSLRGWLAGDTMRCKPVVDIVFLLLNHMPEQEQEATLESFKQFPPFVVEWCIALSLSHPYCALAAVRRWLRGAVVEASLLAVCRRMLADDDGRARSLLLMCLATDDDGDMMISTSTVSKIISLVCAALSPDSPSLERLAGAAAALASELCGAVDCSELATALFRLQLEIQRSSGTLRVETWCELRGAWQDSGAGRHAFRDHAVRDVQRKLNQDTDTLDIATIEHVVSLCPYLLPQFGAAQTPTDLDDTLALVRRLLPEGADHEDAEVFALRHDCVLGALNCPLEDTAAALAVVSRGSQRCPELSRPQVLTFCRGLVFRAGLLRALLLHCEERQPWGEELCQLPYVEDRFAELLHDYAVLLSLFDGYGFWEHYDVIARTKLHVSCALAAVTSELTSLSRRSLRAHVRRRAAADGYYWSGAARALAAMLRHVVDDVGDTPPAPAGLEDVVGASGFYHTLQTESRCSTDRLAQLRAKFLVMLRSFYLAHAHSGDVIDAAFVADAAAAEASDPAVVIHAYYRHQHTMLYDSELASAEWRQVVSSAAVVRYLAEMVDTTGWDAAAASWDFTTISLCSLAAVVRDCDHSWPKVAMLTVAVLQLFVSVHSFVQSVATRSLQRRPAPHVAALPQEWRDIFAPDLNYNLFKIIVNLLCHAEKCPPAPLVAVLDAAMPVARLLDWHALPEPYQSDELSISKLVGVACRALSEPVQHGYKYLAHALLAALAKPLVLHDAEKLAAWSSSATDEEEAPPLLLLLSELLPALQRLQDLVDAALHTLKEGEESCSMVPFTDSHRVALGHLLLADAVYAVCTLARGDLVHHYIELCREGRVAERLAASALQLLPADVATYAHDAGSATPPQQYTHMFLRPPRPSLADPSSSLDVGRLACRALRHTAAWAGAALRGWWGAAPARAARACERLLRGYVSPALVRDQLQAVVAAAHQLEDAEVAVHWSTREVVCVYVVEERRLELSVSLGSAHPLPLPRVAAVGAPQNNTNWLAVYLAYQNGTVLNALRMWMGTVARRVEAAPQCYICYCRLHPASGRLPKVLCHQCRNKFHSECLRKWFSTSSKSNCPLCRATF